MKVKMELDLEVQMGIGSPNGTGCQGYMPEGTTYEELVRVFGDPQITSSLDGKIQAEWFGKINGLQFTIYDYKSPVEPERNTDWHVGGKTELVVILLNGYFNGISSRNIDLSLFLWLNMNIYNSYSKSRVRRGNPDFKKVKPSLGKY